MWVQTKAGGGKTRRPSCFILKSCQHHAAATTSQNWSAKCVAEVVGLVELKQSFLEQKLPLEMELLERIAQSHGYEGSQAGSGRKWFRATPWDGRALFPEPSLELAFPCQQVFFFGWICCNLLSLARWHLLECWGVLPSKTDVGRLAWN